MTEPRRDRLGAARDQRGRRVCPLLCTGETACKKAKRKSGRPGETLFTPPMPGECAMFYNPATKEPT
jgi:hypothetical protein